MALNDENNGGIPATMLVGPANIGGGYTQPYPYPVYQNGGGGGMGGFGDSGVWMILLIVILLAAGGGWGNNNGQGGGFGGQPIIVNDGGNNGSVQRGFDQAAVMSGIGAVQNGVQNLSTQLCGCCGDMQNTVNQGFYNVQQALCNGFANAETSANARHMANMQQAFAAQTAMGQGFNQLGSQLADCCCENRLATERTNYTIATEAAANRAASSRDTQLILDKLCQLELDGVKQNYENRISGISQSYENRISGISQSYENRIVGLQNALDQARSDNQGLRFAASQTAQNAFISQGFANEVDALYNRLSQCPIPSEPVYGRQAIFSCPQNQNNNCGCGCNGNF